MAESNEQQYENNDYDEYADYVFDKALGNIKDDEGTRRSRPRKVPLYQLQIEDKDNIPKMPEKILREPNEEEYKKKIEELKNANKLKSKNIGELIKKKKKEILGIKGEDKNNIFQQHKELIEEAKKIKELIKKDEDAIAPIRSKYNLLNEKVKSYEKFHYSTNRKIIESRIRKIQEQLSFGELTTHEESNLHEEKSNLENYLKILIEFIDFKAKHKDEFGKNIDKKKRLKEIHQQLDEINKEFEEIKKRKDIVKPEINVINNQIQSLIKDKEENSRKIKELYDQWDQEAYAYDEQQKLIAYIKDAQNKIKSLEKKAIKDKRKAEKNEKEENPQEKLKIQTEIKKETPISIKLKKYDEIKEFFTALLPKTEVVEEVKEVVNRNKQLQEDIAKGLYKKIEKEENNILDVKDTYKKKKGKKPSNKKKGGNKANILKIDIFIINKVTELGLNAPLTVDQIPKFLEDLKKMREKIEKGEEIKIEQNEPKKIKENEPEQEDINEKKHENVIEKEEVKNEVKNEENNEEQDIKQEKSEEQEQKSEKSQEKENKFTDILKDAIQKNSNGKDDDIKVKEDAKEEEEEEEEEEEVEEEEEEEEEDEEDKKKEEQ